MSNKTNKLIPELRFPEFVEEGEWEEKSFEELFEIGNGRDYKHLGKGEIPVYGSGGYMLSVNDYLYDGESVCIGRKGTINKPLFLVGKFWTVDTLFYTHSFKECSPKYIHYVFQNIDWLKHNEAGGVPSLSKTNIYKIETLIPNPQEQQKIASCLSSLDEVIAAHSQKLDTLKDHKKGLMQNLFPQEGKTVPKYRFPEFLKDGEWVEKKLGEVADFINGKAYKQEELLSSGKYRVLRVGNFFTNKEWYYSDLELDDDKYCENGDLLYAWSASFGPHIWTEEKVIYHYHIWKVKNKMGLKRNFLYNLLDYETFRMKSTSLNGFALMHITKGTIENWESFIPKSEKEQQKIASCLSSLDDLITAQAEKIEQLKLHKKGLMQGLFPKSITN
jgi:type I restriction enzyme S subunit